MIYPADLTPSLREVLGIANFRCGPCADALRSRGFTIAERADEQAEVIHFLVKLVLDGLRKR